MSEIKEQIDSLQTAIDKKIDIVAKSAGKLSEERMAELKSELKAQMQEHNTLFENLQKQVDSLDMELQKSAKIGKSAKDELSETLKKSADFKAFKSGNGSAIEVKWEGKSIDDRTTANSLLGDTIRPQRLDGIFYDPDRIRHVRDFIPSARTNSNGVEQVQEKLITPSSDFGMIGDGELKTKVEFELEPIVWPVKKIAIFLTVTDEMLEDMDTLVPYLSLRYGRKIPNKEDQQFLYGSGVGTNLQGLANYVLPFSLPSGQTLAPDDNLADILALATTQLLTSSKDDDGGGYVANAIFVSHIFRDKIARLKGSNGQYLFPQALSTGQVVINNAPIIGLSAVEGDDIFVGDFQVGTTIFDRTDQSIAFAREHDQNFTNNKVTIRMEERLAFAIHSQRACIYSSFTAIQANYSAPA